MAEEKLDCYIDRCWCGKNWEGNGKGVEVTGLTSVKCLGCGSAASVHEQYTLILRGKVQPAGKNRDAQYAARFAND